MTFNELVQTNEYTNALGTYKQKLPNFFEYIETNNYFKELLYTPDKTVVFLRSIIFNSINYLTRIEKAVAIWNANDTLNNKESLGYKNTGTSSTNNTSENQSKNSYQGFNVDSDYSKNLSNSTSTSNDNFNRTSVNELDELLKMDSPRYQELYAPIDQQMALLFREVF